MIITKAIIKEVPENGDNIFKVEIPLMEDNTRSEALFDAIMSTSPGISGGIKVGDCVIVSFEDDKYNTAIILGKLFTGSINDDSTLITSGTFGSLNVKENATLPINTKIGTYSMDEVIKNLYNGVSNGGSGSGSVDPEELKQYVQWTVTERPNEDPDEVFADHIRVMTGKEYDDYKKSDDFDEELFNKTLYFLSSLPNEEGN